MPTKALVIASCALAAYLILYCVAVDRGYGAMTSPGFECYYMPMYWGLHYDPSGWGFPRYGHRSGWGTFFYPAHQLDRVVRKNHWYVKYDVGILHIPFDLLGTDDFYLPAESFPQFNASNPRVQTDGANRSEGRDDRGS